VLDFAYDPPDRETGKPFKWIVIDSLIISLIVFVSILPPDRPPTLNELYAAFRGFMYAFLVQLGIERGLKPIIKKGAGE